MGLADDLEGVPLTAALCSVHRAMITNPEHADTIFTFCTLRHDKELQTLSDVLAAHNIDLEAQSISRHRRGICKCNERMPERYDS